PGTPDRSRGDMGKGGVRAPEMPVVDGEDFPRIQAQVGRIRAQAPPDVDITEQGLESLPLERLEVVGPDPGLPGGLLDGLPSQEARLAQRRTDPDADALHSLIV